MPKSKQDWLLDVMRNDSEFLVKMGIEPCPLDDPFLKRPSSQEPEGPEIPLLTERDDRWLHSCGATWESQPEPGFVPPENLTEYIRRYPKAIKEACAVAAAQLNLSPSSETLDEWAEEVLKSFREFAQEGLEDVVGMFITAPLRRPGQPLADHFKAYMEMRVLALLPLVI